MPSRLAFTHLPLQSSESKARMRYILIILGGLLLLYAVLSTLAYALDYGQLSAYGRGHVWGKLILGLIGGAMLYFGLRNYFVRTSD